MFENQHKRFQLLIIGVVAFGNLYFAGRARADDTYNFYFQKKTENKPKPQKVVENLKISKKKKDLRTWEISLGMGQVEGFAPVNYDRSNSLKYQSMLNYTQPLYILSGRYFYNRYFGFHGQLNLPRGEIDGIDGQNVYVNDENGEYYVPVNKESSFDFQMLVGADVTPFHFDFLGFTFMEIGIDLSVLLGDENYLGGNSAALMWGPRVSFLFSRSFALTISRQDELQRNLNSSLFLTNLSLNYRF